jgi:hypothetical protein
MSGKKLPSPRGIAINTTTLSTEEDQARGSTTRRITLEDNSYMDTALSQSMIAKKPLTRTL